MDRSVARRLLAAGLLIGVLAEVVLDGPAYGLNILIVVAALLGAGWLLRRPGRAPDPLDAWLPITALALAAFVAVRGDPFMALVDTMGALAFTGASLVAFSGLPVTRRSASVVAVHGGDDVRGDRGRDRACRSAPSDRRRRSRSVRVPVRARSRSGAACSWPSRSRSSSRSCSRRRIRSSGRPMTDLLGWQPRSRRAPRTGSCSSSPARGSRPGCCRSRPSGSRRSRARRSGPRRGPGSWCRRGRLGAAEALVVLVVIDAVVGLFVGLQVAYLFGGQSTLVAAGMTYSDYARRGFFELVAAACLAGAVVVVLEATVARRSRPYLVALLGLLALTAVVLVSAALRLRLYQDAYGWTELRLYVLTTIVSLAVALVLMTGARRWPDRMRWLGHGLAVIGVVALVALNLVAPVGLRGGTQRRAGHRSGPRRAGRPRGSRRRPTSASCPTMRSRSWSRHSPRCRHGNGRRVLAHPRTSERPSSRPIRRSPARPPGTSDASGRGRRWRPCHDLTAGSDRRPAALSLGHGTPLRTAARTDARQGRRRPAVRRRLAVRAEVGRLPGARLPRRRRGLHPVARPQAARPLLPRAGRSAPGRASRALRPRRRGRHRRATARSSSSRCSSASTRPPRG